MKHIILILSLLLINILAFSQYDSVVGTVYDMEGSPIEGVKITAKPVNDMYPEASTYSNEKGKYKFVRLMVGDYEFHHNKDGFSQGSHTIVHVHSDFKLLIKESYMTLYYDFDCGISVTPVYPWQVDPLSTSMRHIYINSFLTNVP